MNGIFLAAFAMFCVPTVLAISCYNCMPSGITELCTNPTNVTNCDNEPQTVPGTNYDACVQATIEFKFGDNTFKSGAMMCGVKAYCGIVKESFCNSTKGAMGSSGIKLDKCDLSCCETDKCNTGGEPPSADGTSTAASFVVMAMSFLVLLSGILHH